MKSSRYVSTWIFLALIATISPISAADYIVGAEEGDWIKYEVVGTLPTMEEYDWVKLEVQSVDGTTVAVLATAHYRDGREESNTLSWDVGTGGEVWMIPAGLEKEDAFPYGDGYATLNDTVTLVYAGASRTVNVLHLLRNDVDTEMIARWDQATGFLVELFVNNSSPTENWAGGYRAIETNMWWTALRVTVELIPETATVGETVTISSSVDDESGNPIEGATVIAEVDGRIVDLSDVGGGNYEGALEITDFMEGTYGVYITAEKDGYGSAETTHALTVEAIQLQVDMQLSTDTVTRGEVMTVSATITDVGGRPIGGAIVTVYIGDIALDLAEIGDGSYQVTVETSNIQEGTYTVIVAAHKEGCESGQTSENLTVEAAPEEPPWAAYGAIAVAAVAIVAVALYLVKRRH